MTRTDMKLSAAIQPTRWAVLAVVIAILTAMAAPIGAMAAQTPAAAASDGVISVVPDSALAFAHINLDTSSGQMVLARQLSERAGLGDPVEQLDADGEFPENARVGVVVLSIPATGDFEVTDVAADPTQATESLEAGGFAAIVEADDVEGTYASQIEDMQSSADIDGGELAETEYGGVTITSYEPTDEFSDPTAVAMVGEFVVIAALPEDIHPIIDTYNGDTASLSTSENYQKVNALLPEESISNGYLDGPALLASADASNPEALDVADPRTTALLDSWSGYALTAEEDGFRLVTKSIATDGAFDEMTPIDGSFYDSVRSDALFAINGVNIDSTGALTMLAFIFASDFAGDDTMATPVGDVDIATEQDRVFEEAEQVLGFNLKTDLIDYLNGEFGLTVSISDIMSDMPQVNALIVSHVDNPQAVTGTMAKIALIVGAGLGDQNAVEDRKVGDATVNSVDISDSGLGDKLDFGVVGEDLVIGVGSGMDDYVDGAEEPMSEDPNFMAVMEHLPSEYGSLTYVNIPVLLELVMGFSEGMTMETTDADPSCGEYASQEEAQAAYDADQFENFELDQDFDGEACEDYFGGTPVASPAASANPYENMLGLGSVTTLEDDVYSSETFLLIGGQ